MSKATKGSKAFTSPSRPSECKTVGDFLKYLRSHGMDIVKYWDKPGLPFNFVELEPDDFQWIADNLNKLNRHPRAKQIMSINAQLQTNWTNGLPGSHLVFSSEGLTIDGGTRVTTFARQQKPVKVALWWNSEYESAIEQVNAAAPMRSGDRIHRLCRIHGVHPTSGRPLGNKESEILGSAGQMLYAIETGKNIQMNNISVQLMFKFIKDWRPLLIDCVEWACETVASASNIHRPTLAVMKFVLSTVDEKTLDLMMSGALGMPCKKRPQPFEMLCWHFSTNCGHYTCRKALRRTQTWAFLTAWTAYMNGREVAGHKNAKTKDCCELSMANTTPISALSSLIGGVMAGVDVNSFGPLVSDFEKSIAQPSGS